jgi:hypothetical protein
MSAADHHDVVAVLESRKTGQRPPTTGRDLMSVGLRTDVGRFRPPAPQNALPADNT